ncbi:MAG: hypothetical protein ACRDKS_06575, partial [Actinomycetota bacterium]
DGKSIFKILKGDGDILDALRQGQMAFFVAIDRIAGEVGSGVNEFLRDREQFVRTLRTVGHELELETTPRRRRRASG